LVIFIFDMNNDIVSRVLVNKYKILSNIGNIYVNIVRGNIIILIIGTKIMFSKILYISKIQIPLHG
jgi:hypothetical protein